ncbi:MAG: hypothetical protein KF712_09975 [Akkermansiaceae bacterium]|nr:hypothetical protein [Akkermansiaceae bacterium]
MSLILSVMAAGSAVAAPPPALDVLLAEAPETVAGAEDPAQLDALISRLSAVNTGGGGVDSPEEREMKLKVLVMRDLVTRWQDYLSAVKADRPAEALRLLNDMKSMGRIDMILPRSRILGLMDGIAGADETDRIVSEIGSLDQVGDAITKLQSIWLEGYPIGRQISGLIVMLAEIEQSYRDYKSGLPFSLRFKIDLRDVASRNSLAKIIELRSQMVLIGLPDYVGAPSGTKALEGEQTRDFITRIETEARERGDIPVVVECRRVRAFFKASGEPSSLDEGGVQSLLAARNQEQAGQYDLAVVSYQMALRHGGDLVPADWVGSRLKVIEAEHPGKFREGMSRIPGLRPAK